MKKWSCKMKKWCLGNCKIYQQDANMKELPIWLPIPMQLTGKTIVKRTDLGKTSWADEKVKFWK